jgi:hypothetical protein
MMTEIVSMTQLPWLESPSACATTAPAIIASASLTE